MSSQISQAASQLDSEIKAGFYKNSSQHAVTDLANHERHLTVLAHLDDHSKKDDLSSKNVDTVIQRQLRSIDMNEAGFQAVHSSLIAASSSSSDDHKATHAMLNQCQGQLQQVLRNHVTFGTIGDSVHSSIPCARAPKKSAENTVFWKYSSYRLPIGLLKIHLQQCKSSTRSVTQVRTEPAIAIDSLPPRWLSRVAINYSMKLYHDLIRHQWRLGETLNPLTINYNPFFINAVQSLDVEGVRRSFAEGLARPTDYLLGSLGNLDPWYQVCLQSISNGNMLNWFCSFSKL